MKKTTSTIETPNKRKNWLSFVMGVMLGFVLGISIYFVDKYVFEEKIHFSSAIDKLYRPLQHHQKSPAKHFVLSKKTENAPVVEPEIVIEENAIPVDTIAGDLVTDQELDISGEETEFTLPDEKVKIKKEEIEIVSDVLLLEKRIAVQYISERTDSTKMGKADFFTLEQWSSPIKNRHTYQLKNKILKLKGVDISRVTIVNYEDDYYLLYNESFFSIRPNAKFEKLIEVSLSNE